MNEFLIGALFLIQACAILLALYFGAKIAKGEPLVPRDEGYMDVPQIPEDKPLDFDIEEPPISWKPRMAEDGKSES